MPSKSPQSNEPLLPDGSKRETALAFAAILKVATPKGKFQAMATLVSQTVAVTSCHVIWQSDFQKAKRKSVTVNPFYGGSRDIAATVEGIDEKLDLATIRLAEPVPYRVPIDRILGDPWSGGQKWSAVFSRQAEMSISFLTGTIGVKAMPSGYDWPLFVSESSLASAAPWAEISGGPVISANELTGIITFNPLKGESLYGIPISEIIKTRIGEEIHVVIRGDGKGPTSRNLEESGGEEGQNLESRLRWLDQETINRFSVGLRSVLGRAEALRGNHKSDRVEVEYILFALGEGIGESQLPWLCTERGIGLGQLLEPGLGPRPEVEDADDDRPRGLTGVPLISTETRSALLFAVERANEEGSELIEAAHLLFGALSVRENPRVAELNRLGITPEQAIVPPTGPVAALARRTYSLAGYQSDDPSGTDLLDITEEVNALGSVIAARDVEPPLSLGLFGDWGTGKSFFMKMLEARIKKLADDAKAAEIKKEESAYCSSVLQIAFNAWNYIDSDLWASLTAEIFENLAAEIVRLREPDSKIDSAAKRALVLAAASSSRSVLDEAESKKREAETELKQTEAKLADLHKSEAAIEAKLTSGEILKQALGFAMQNEEMKTYVGKVTAALQIPEARAAASEVQSEILELEGTWSQIVFTLKHGRNLWIWLAVLGVVLVAGWEADKILVDHDIAKDATRIVTATITVLGFLRGILVPFVQTSRKLGDAVAKAQQSKQKLIERKKQEQVADLEKRREVVRQNVETASKKVTAAHEKVKELNEQLENMRADRNMADFIRARNQSTDYTQHLGVISRVRNDLRQLSTLLRNVKLEAEAERALKERQEKAERERQDAAACQSKQGTAGKEELRAEAKGGTEIPVAPLFPRIDRIILYIDDLDRCPEETVVKVLQAVHLLLAFPLFVVVVGVDPRWLLYSLRQSSSAFRNQELAEGVPQGTGNEDQWRSTPLNYLEKIFQIPFTLRPIRREGFRRMVDKYAAQSLAERGESAGERSAPTPGAQSLEQTHGDAVNQPRGTSPETDTGKTPVAGPGGSAPRTEHAVAASPIEAPIDRSPEYLNISESECEFMKELHRFIPSPRAGKRFINIYRLLRASVREKERKAFAGDKDGGSYRTAMLLLAILTGHPDEATEMFRELLEEKPTGSWSGFCAAYESRVLPGGKEEAEEEENSYGIRKGRKAAKARKATQKPIVETDGVPEPAGGPDEPEWSNLFEKLKEVETLVGGRTMEEFVEWAPRVARYSFQSGRVLYYQQE